ncbi:unnamed protein product [Lactuca virosa]|uniref:F-box domain-containing protein n=1 Tax=Lactuca virosa TaxID=75947 RepID=A0AAU9N8S2_9ASTR|nr:unnamed protein product [Lactuca virosa]
MKSSSSSSRFNTQIGIDRKRHSEMDMTRRETRNHNDDDASNSKTIKTDDVRFWSYLNHDMLLLVMMKLGVIDFVAFSGVCKSWRSVALSNRKSFMASKPPMLTRISGELNKDKKFRLEDHEGRKFKTINPHSVDWYYKGLTSCYLILFRFNTKEYWLVNPITRHELIFPPIPWETDYGSRSVLVFSPSISKMVFVVLAQKQIWFSIADEGTWNHVSSFDLKFCRDLHVFKGKIYTVDTNNFNLCEFRLNPEPKVTLLETKNLPEDPRILLPQLVSCGENLYVMGSSVYAEKFNVFKLDFGEMEWVHFEDTRDECGFFLSEENYSAAVKPELWADPWSHYVAYDIDNGGEHEKILFSAIRGWYFPHECENVNLIEES